MPKSAKLVVTPIEPEKEENSKKYVTVKCPQIDLAGDTDYERIKSLSYTSAYVDFHGKVQNFNAIN